MTDTNDERLRVAVRAHCFEEMVDRECTYPVCSLRCGKISEGHGRAIIAAIDALDAHDRAQAWGPEAREAMARDACNAWLNAPGSDWLLVVDAVLRHVRGPMPSGLTIGMSSAAIQAYREGPGDIVERMDRALTAALAAAPQPDQPMPPPPSSARPENGSETMAGAARDVAAEDFAIMLRRMIWQTRKATGDDSMKVLAGQAEALLSRHGMPGNPLRADGPTPQPGEA